MTPVRILCVHGIGDHHSDLTWQDQWKVAISNAIAYWDRDVEPQLDFMMYDDIFAAKPLTVRGSIEAVYKLLGSAIDSPFRRERGLFKPEQLSLRWHAGMVVQWVEDEEIRAETRDRLVEQIRQFDPEVVCGHSLGSLVCYDTFSQGAGRTAMREKTFVSLGSQIANPFVAGNFLAGRIEPLDDVRWYNLYNECDSVFTAPIRLSAPTYKQVDTRFDIPGMADHDAPEYLGHRAATERMWSEIVGQRRYRRFVRGFQETIARERVARREPQRRALLVGINDYPDEANRLEGCVNDVFLVSAILQECGFQPEEIRVVLNERATAQGILERLEWLLDRPKPDDQLVFYYSGHGAQLPTYGVGDVVDRMDEALVPYDFDWTAERAITDDQIYELYSQLPYDTHFLMLLDCCHSGGMARAGMHRPKGVNPPDDIRHRMLRWDLQHRMWVARDFAPQNPELSPDAGERRAYVGDSGAVRRLGRAVALRRLPTKQYDQVRRRRKHEGPFLPVVVQACRENELAYEYRHGVISHGAFTFCLGKILRERGEGRGITFQRLVADVADELEALQYDQRPSVIGPDVRIGARIPWMMRIKSPSKAPRKRKAPLRR